ncbi:hypothetical protein [Streptomyces sp. NPDC005181]|uniref:hypothetical protein n=1 Tax=Streptomyces sp. NPDC005181 TaxID=3156869 RepID=UPI0033B52BEB
MSPAAPAPGFGADSGPDYADAAEAPEPAPSAEHLAGLDAIERTRYVSIGEATDDDINVYVTVVRKG